MTTNIERAYLTTVSPEDLAQAVAENFRAHDFQVQTFRTPDPPSQILRTRRRRIVTTRYAW